MNYNYDDKYYLEASLRHDSKVYLFEGYVGKRWVTLPGVSAGWRLNNESCSMPPIMRTKLRAGIGKQPPAA